MKIKDGTLIFQDREECMFRGERQERAWSEYTVDYVVPCRLKSQGECDEDCPVRGKIITAIQFDFPAPYVVKEDDEDGEKQRIWEIRRMLSEDIQK